MIWRTNSHSEAIIVARVPSREIVVKNRYNLRSIWHDEIAVRCDCSSVIWIASVRLITWTAVVNIQLRNVRCLVINAYDRDGRRKVCLSDSTNDTKATTCFNRLEGHAEVVARVASS
ncbi:MAG: hypothetical protein DMF68_14285 [Acidobacteria bacterium]|nr:MAG: hypothetical protein DMF68_14285 [Acidobacteriota bacterium]